MRYKTLCRISDCLTDNSNNDWRVLADELGYDRTAILRFEDMGRRLATNNACYHMLDDWLKSDGATIHTLKTKLKDIGRLDVESVLEQEENRPFSFTAVLRHGNHVERLDDVSARPSHTVREAYEGVLGEKGHQWDDIALVGPKKIDRETNKPLALTGNTEMSSFIGLQLSFEVKHNVATNTTPSLVESRPSAPHSGTDTLVIPLPNRSPTNSMDTGDNSREDSFEDSNYNYTRAILREGGETHLMQTHAPDISRNATVGGSLATPIVTGGYQRLSDVTRTETDARQVYASMAENNDDDYYHDARTPDFRGQMHRELAQQGVGSAPRIPVEHLDSSSTSISSVGTPQYPPYRTSAYSPLSSPEITPDTSVSADRIKLLFRDTTSTDEGSSTQYISKAPGERPFSGASSTISVADSLPGHHLQSVEVMSQSGRTISWGSEKHSQHFNQAELEGLEGAVGGIDIPYHGTVSREELVSLVHKGTPGWYPNFPNSKRQMKSFMTEYLKEDGRYMFRPHTEKSKASTRTNLMVSVIHRQQFKHFIIHRKTNIAGVEYFYFYKDQFKAKSIDDLLAHYEHHDLFDPRDPTPLVGLRLTKPIFKPCASIQ